MDEQKTQPIAVPASPAQTGQQTAADTQPLPQHSQQSQYTQQSQYPQYGEPQYQNAQYQPASYSPQPQQNAPAPAPAKRRRRSIIIAVIAVITIVASWVGAYVYHSRHEQALSDCRNAVSEFTKVRKELLDTGGSSSQIQQLLRNMLGVSDILDAAADASSSAEQTVSAEGCAANATITQLNLVKDTVASATDSLRTSIDSLKKDASKLAAGGSSSRQDADGGSSTGKKDTGSGSTGDGTDSTLEQSRKELQSTIDSARTLLDQLKNSELNNTLKQLASNALSTGLKAAQNLANDQTITDSHAYETAKSTLEQAISAAKQWLESQAANQ
ncbi:hypothetical protein [Bifidobacterium angulatum]|uniref:hypothetical protein n=1 Tax=Bifidobacterium angulatum TaxID=1683 RepID=UPI002E79C670|nr:hypothetical protein [Bifidobacterium angulatum]MEE0331784.1 hypothetical protein [Bifidobacterium angulatum]